MTVDTATSRLLDGFNLAEIASVTAQNCTHKIHQNQGRAQRSANRHHMRRATAEAGEAIVDREHRIVIEMLANSCREKLGATTVNPELTA